MVPVLYSSVAGEESSVYPLTMCGIQHSTAEML